MSATGGSRDGPRKIRVLVVDDSVVIRRLVTGVLADDSEIDVVGIAENGKIAIARVAELHPDVVTMDIEMPVMNGIEAVRALRRSQPRLPVVMFSTLTERGAAATLDALAAGASDYVTKPSNVGSLGESRQNIKDQLIPKLKALAGARRLAALPRPAGAPLPASVVRPRPARTAAFQALVIGSSTGGPDALARVLPNLPADLPVPVLVVQHMPPVFTRLLAQRLDGACPLTVREAVENDPVVPGQVLIAPGGLHLEPRRRAAGVVAHLSDAPPENFCRPAVDVLFRGAAAVWSDRVLAVVLTGMGRDGEVGSRAVRDAGGSVYAQDQASSVVWGMPGAVASAGLAEQLLDLDVIGPTLSTALGRPAAAGTGLRSPQPLGGTR